MWTGGERGEWQLACFVPQSGLWREQESLPAPDNEPFEPSVRSNLQTFRTIQGQQVGINLQAPHSHNPLRMTWTAMSGSSLKETLERYVESGTGVQFLPSFWQPPQSGVFVEVRPRLRPGLPTETWDIQAEFQPLKVENADAIRFRSGFDESLGVLEQVGSDGYWRIFLTGTDPDTGHTWLLSNGASTLPGAGSSFFSTRTSGTSALHSYSYLEIASGGVLRLRVLGDDPTDTDKSRVMLTLNIGDHFYTEGYTRYKLKFQDNLDDYDWQNWREVMQIRSSSGSAANQETERIFLQIIRQPPTPIFWRLASELGPFTVADQPGSGTPNWTIDNTDTPVVSGAWLEIEAGFKPGYVGVKINGHVIAERWGEHAIGTEGAKFWTAISAYSSFNTLLSGEFMQHVDDFEIRLGPLSMAGWRV